MMKDEDSSPITTPVCRAAVGTPESMSARPTSTRERRWSESWSTGSSSGCSPPRYTMRCTWASCAAVPKVSAISTSSRTKSSESPMECSRYHATSTSCRARATSAASEALPSTTSASPGPAERPSATTLSPQGRLRTFSALRLSRRTRQPRRSSSWATWPPM